jgi:hypothetical protein
MTTQSAIANKSITQVGPSFPFEPGFAEVLVCVVKKDRKRKRLFSLFK